MNSGSMRGFDQRNVPQADDDGPCKPVSKRKTAKTVRWQTEEQLEEIKYFKMNDEPIKPGLSLTEVQEIQKHLADVPAHLIPSEIQKIEMQLDGRRIKELKNMDT